MTTQQKIEYLTRHSIINPNIDISYIIDTLNRVISVVNQLVPALPEDEDCEVVEVIDDEDGFITGDCTVFNFTKPDGKKLKIKVTKP
jgi:hypothetical protein